MKVKLVVIKIIFDHYYFRLLGTHMKLCANIVYSIETISNDEINQFGS